MVNKPAAPVRPNPFDNVVQSKKQSSSSSRGPLDIEAILQKKKDADAAAAKPKFLTKAQREKLALEKREKEVEEQKRKAEAGRARFETQSNGHAYIRERESYPANGSRDVVPTGPKAMRKGGQSSGSSRSGQNGTHTAGNGRNGDMGPPSRPVNGAAAKRAASNEDIEAALRKTRYMGEEKNKSTFSAQKKRRRTEGKKFNFEWNAEEDTSGDYNPIYQERAELSLFGRGRLGGFAEDKSEDAALKYFQSVAERDPETGQARLREFLEMKKRAAEAGARNGLTAHWSQKKLEHMRERDWRIFKEDFNIATKGGGIPNPMRSWSESGLPESILDVVAQVGYTEPSSIQRAAIPIALQARDLIGVAVTGSGKTAAFLLPLLVYIQQLPKLNDLTKNDGPYAIILAPTRELAQQIEVEAKKFATPMGFRCVSLVGGHSIAGDITNLQEGAEIIIATPGRLVDCIETRVLVLGQCCYIIMDEADRMIDMGFEEPVNKILDALPVGNEKPDTDEAEDSQAMSRYLGGVERYRQTMMYTATMPPAIEKIAKKYLRRPAIVTIGTAGEAVETVEQRVEFVAGEDKRKKRLIEILRSGEFNPPMIVFVNIKRNCDAIARYIKDNGFTSVTMHGSKTQDQREAALLSVRNGQTSVLVATDLAGRGIDVPDVSLVVNFNMATNIESYTHRIGRTGRAGKSGVAITFLGAEDTDTMYDLKQMLSKSSISRVPEELRRHEAAQQKTQRGGGGSGGGGDAFKR